MQQMSIDSRPDFTTLAAPRVITARRVTAFDEQEVIHRLFAQGYIPEAQAFMLVEQLARPLAETMFDVCHDGVTLYISVLARESNAFYGSVEGDDAPAGGGTTAWRCCSAHMVMGTGICSMAPDQGRSAGFAITGRTGMSDAPGGASVLGGALAGCQNGGRSGLADFLPLSAAGDSVMTMPARSVST